jgi:asparagine synthase (glutamine-hydrolysing)
VEARPPFLDHALWEFCASLPPEVRLGRADDKRLLRVGLRGRLPEQVLRQPKRGLAAPHAAWLRAERLPAWAEEALHPAALQDAGYFVPAEVVRLRREHQAGRRDNARLLMGVLTAQLWGQECVR